MNGDQKDKTQPTMPQDLAARMQAIIMKHAEGYRNDLPVLIEEMRVSIEHIAVAKDEDVFATLQRQAHDMKGQAATFGLKGITAIASSMSRLMEKKTSVTPAVTAALKAHVMVLKQLLQGDNSDLVEKTIEAAKDL